MATWRKKRKRMDFAPVYARLVEEESAVMAIAGGMTSAYQFVIEDFTLKTVKATTYPSANCANIEAAVAILERGEHCIVAAGDVAKLRQRLAGLGIG